MFRNAKVGDRVWSFEFGWGTIVEIKNNFTYSIFIKFDGQLDLFSFTFSGKRFNETKQTLFWNEIKFEIPKRKLKKWIAICVFDKIRLVMVKNSSLGKTDTLLDVNSDALALFDTKEEALKCVPCVKYTFEVEIEE